MSSIRTAALLALASAPTALVPMAFTPTALTAQIVTGRVVDSASQRPLGAVTVRLLARRDSARDTVVDTRTTADDGVFTLLAPAPGTYRVWMRGGALGPALALTTADSTDARQYVLAPLDLARVYGVEEVTQRARIVRGSFAVRMPQVLVERAGSRPMCAEARLRYVVDTLGHASGITALEVSAPELAPEAVRAMGEARFEPARIDGRVVRQLVIDTVRVVTYRAATVHQIDPRDLLFDATGCEPPPRTR